MTKKETIWREILYGYVQRGEVRFTQKGLAEQFGFSLSTVFNAMSVPRNIGAVEVTGRFFRLRDPEKLFILWATHRNLSKDVLYKTHSELPVKKIEADMPPGILFGGFSAWRFSHGSVPADYGVVYVYVDDPSEIKRRFPPKKGYPNVFVIKKDSFLTRYVSKKVAVIPDVQMFVDIWNTPEWYTRDFLTALKKQLKLE